MSSGKGLLGDAPIGIDPKILTNLKITGPVTNSVFIYNLDKEKVTNENLKEVFDLAGKVLIAEVYSKDGKSIGCGSVLFEHNVEAVQAISMFHHQVFHGKTMGVKMDARRKETRKTASKLPSGLTSIGPGLGPHGLSLKGFSNDSLIEGCSPHFTSLASRASTSREPGAVCGYGDNRLPGYRDSSLVSGTGDGLFQCSDGRHQKSGRGMGNRNINRNNFDQVPGNQARNQGWGSGKSSGPGRSYTSLTEMMSDLDIGDTNQTNRASQKSSSHGHGRNQMNREQTSIICKNLPDSTVKEELCQRFDHIGPIRYVSILRDKNGSSRGCGIIRFSTKEEALKAVSTMDGFKLSSRIIEVKLL